MSVKGPLTFYYIVLLELFFVFSNPILTSNSEPLPIPITPTTEESTKLPPSSSCSCCENTREHDPERFSKLKLNVRELLGSRWAIDKAKNHAISVSHAIDITDATLIHDNQLTLRVEFNLRQSWEAPGLVFPKGLFKDEDPPGTFVSADDKVLANMWSPDSYISTSRESNMNTVGTPLSLVYIFKNRTIIFKVRMFTKVGCTSSFQWYPLDVQTCTLTIESYKYHDNIAQYHWTDEKLYRPVVHKIRRLFQYNLRKPLKYDSGFFERGGRGKRYAYVRIRFKFERKLGNNIIQVYTPTILIVSLSWFSFWLGLDAIPGRISLLVTCMLTLVTMHSGIKSSIPPVHYITMMDVWMVCCMGMVFSAMCEFVVVKYVHWRQHQKHKEAEKLKDMEKRDAFIDLIQQIQLKMFGESKVGAKSEPGKISSIPWNPKLETGITIPKIFIQDEELRSIKVESGQMEEKVSCKFCGGKSNLKNKKEMKLWWVGVDKFCRGFFPLLFLLFNGIYWSVLLNCGSESHDEKSYHHS